MNTNILCHRVQLGPMDNFIYIFSDSHEKNCFIVDPAWDTNYLFNHIEKNDLKLSFVLITHGHMDHVNGLPFVLEKHKVPVYFSKNETAELNLSHPDIDYISEGKRLAFNNTPITCLDTPGHTPGSMSFIIDKWLITGDTLFNQGCGRCDFSYSNLNDMWNSLEKLKSLPDHLLVCPGHSYGYEKEETLGNLKQANSYLNSSEKSDFIEKRTN